MSDMQISPAQLRQAIDKVRQYGLRNDHALEFAEAIAENAPTYLRSQMDDDLLKLREVNRMARRRLSQVATALETILQEDEANNGWKGEDRYIDLSPQQE